MKSLLAAAALIAGAAGILYLINPPARGFKIHSDILGETRRVLEFLPEGYDSSDESYPVLIHLDAGRRPSVYGPSYYAVAESLNSLGEPVPKMIVLGIVNKDRNQDMLPVRIPDLPSSGGAGLFLRFITKELVPKVKTAYRTSGEWILYGRSDSGLFALYALTEAPDAFQAVIASSPTLGRCPAFMTDRVEKLFREHPDLAATLYIVYGSNEAAMVTGPLSGFAEAIQHSAPVSFILETKSVPGGGHIPKSSLEDGLRFVFSADRAEFLHRR